MASAWGTSWGSSWASSWGSVQPQPDTQPTGGGTSRRKKKRGKVLRWSEYETVEARAQALREALQIAPVVVRAPAPERFDSQDDDDDEAIIQALTVTLLH